MGTGGDITMTNLKGATGIADDRLSAHHPNGAGNETAMGDFLINDIGRDDGSGTRVTDLRAGNDNNPLTNTPGTVQLCDFFYVLIEHLSEKYWDQQIGLRQSALELVSTSNITQRSRVVLDNTTDQNTAGVIGVRFEVTGTGTGFADFRLRDGMNTDANNYDTALTWDSSNDPNASIRGASDIVVENVSVNSSGGGTGTIQKDITVNWWDPDDQAAELYIAINPGARDCSFSQTDTSLATANSCGIRSEDYTAFFDESTCEGNTYDLDVRLDDSNGNQLDSYTQSITI